jgi:hypothetical protein
VINAKVALLIKHQWCIVGGDGPLAASANDRAVDKLAAKPDSLDAANTDTAELSRLPARRWRDQAQPGVSAVVSERSVDTEGT